MVGTCRGRVRWKGGGMKIGKIGTGWEDRKGLLAERDYLG